MTIFNAFKTLRYKMIHICITKIITNANSYCIQNASTVNDAGFLFPWCIKNPIICCSVENLLILAFILSPKNSDTTCVFYWYIFHSDLGETPNTHDFFIQTPTKGLVPHFCNTLSEEYRFYHI